MPRRKLSKRLERRATFYKRLNLKEYDVSAWLEDRAGRAIVADKALDISEGADDASIIAAFDAFVLNPANPWHWRELLKIFAEEHFRPSPPAKNKQGRPPTRNEEHLRMLEHHFKQWDEWRRRAGKKWPGSESAAHLIRAAFPHRYAKFSVDETARYIARLRKSLAI